MQIVFFSNNIIYNSNGLLHNKLSLFYYVFKNPFKYFKCLTLQNVLKNGHKTLVWSSRLHSYLDTIPEGPTLLIICFTDAVVLNISTTVIWP